MDISNISTTLGRLVVCGVPAVIGGGIVYALFGENYTAVAVYEILLMMTAGAFIAR